MATLKDLKSAPPVPVKRRSQILDAVPSRFRRKTKMSKNAKHKRGAQSNKFFGRESKAKYLKKRKPFKTTLSSEHGATSESKANAHALSSNDVLQLSASSQSPAASGPSVQSLSAHRLPAVPQIEVADRIQTPQHHPLAASLPSHLSHYQIEEALYLDDRTPFGTTAIVTTTDITSFSSSPSVNPTFDPTVSPSAYPIMEYRVHQRCTSAPSLSIFKMYAFSVAEFTANRLQSVIKRWSKSLVVMLSLSRVDIKGCTSTCAHHFSP